MTQAASGFQVFVKPAGPRCNLNCRYCYYLEKDRLYPKTEIFRMPDDLLDDYISQHIDASPDEVIRFSWHGGEPTVLGLEYFRKIVALQRRHGPADRRIANGMQTNGILLDEDWCRFLSTEGFAVGLSLDGPPELHDRNRVTRNGRPTFERTMHAYELLRRHQVSTDILCVVNSQNVRFPSEVYRFFKKIEAAYVTFLPLVEPQAETDGGVSPDSVPAESWGTFLSTIFDEWVDGDIGRIKVQIFEEAARPAFNQEHSLCIFRPVCGDIPVVEHNGDFYSCDHYVDAAHRLGNIRETPLVELLESPQQRAFGNVKLETLPRYCRECEVRIMCNGECPKNRFARTPGGEAGLNYLCAGYKTFFTHCRPFVEEVAAEWRRRTPEGQPQPTPAAAPKKTSLKSHRPGRNDPCPCGSGKKYKRCCLGK